MSKSVTFKLAGAAALAASSQAYGQIIITPPSNIPGNDPSASPGFVNEFYDVQTGATSASATGPGFTADFEFQYYNIAETGGNYFSTRIIPLLPGDSFAGNGFYFYNADAIPSGAKVGSDNYTFVDSGGSYGSATLAESYGSPATSFSSQQVDQKTFLGFQFTGSDSLIHDGYIELESESYVSPSNPGGLIFFGAAYNSAADALDGSGDITTPAIPEPGTLSSLMLGAAALGGVGLLRRRRSLLAQD